MKIARIVKAPRGRVLVFTAHPDDHICAAGTLMLLAAHGFSIHEVVATGGEKGVWWSGKQQKRSRFKAQELVRERRRELQRASQLIGIAHTTFLGLPDSEVERNGGLVTRLMGVIRQERPAVVMSMSEDDYHHDHRALSRIVREAADRAAWSHAPEMGDSYKVPVFLQMEGFYVGRPEVVVDITAYRARKEELLDIYASQVDDRERRLLQAMNHYHGFFRRDPAVVSAEGFSLVREFPLFLNHLMTLFGKN